MLLKIRFKTKRIEILSLYFSSSRFIILIDSSDILKGLKMADESCKKCRFWKEFGKMTFEKERKSAGFCRKLSPRSISVSLGSFKDSLRYRFPVSAADDWCGQFEKRPISVEGTAIKESTYE